MNEKYLPSKHEMMGWVSDFTKWPHRQTGTKEGRESAEYVKDIFDKLGLERTEIQSVPSLCHFDIEYSLEIAGEKIDCFPANGTNRKGEEGLFESRIKDAEVVYLGKGLEKDFENVDVAGKIVVCDIFFKPHSYKSTPNATFYDPKGKFDEDRNIYDIFSPNNWPFNYMYAMENGAAGFVGILQNFMDENYYHEDYTFIIDLEHPMEMPALWVSRANGQKLVKNIDTTDGNKGSLTVVTEYVYKDALNVSGYIEGMTDDVIVIQSHHDATGKGAVQDASGMSVVFALAKYLNSLPKEEIKTTLLFLSTDSHYTDYEGHDKFLDKCESENLNIIMDFAIEHIAKLMNIDENNKSIVEDEPESRILYVTDIKGLPDIALKLLKKYNLEHTMILKTADEGNEDFDPDYVSTDAYTFHERGIPVVSHLTAPMYLFHNTDDINKVHEDSLEPVSMFYLDMLKEVWNLFRRSK